MITPDCMGKSYTLLQTWNPLPEQSVRCLNITSGDPEGLRLLVNDVEGVPVHLDLHDVYGAMPSL